MSKQFYIMKKAIVIGASSGIGEGIARTLAKDGYCVGITGRRTELLEKIKTEKPDAFLVKTMDVTKGEENIKKIEELVAELGGLDLLIFSSGTGNINPELDFEIEKPSIETNVTGFTRIADWSFNYFEKQKQGHFVAISSIGGLRGSRQAPAYNATKAYQINYLEGLRQKANKLDCKVFVTDIRPGLVDTDMAKGEGLFWVMPVEEVVSQIYNAIKKRKKVAYVTKRWRILAFIMKRLPRFVADKM